MESSQKKTKWITKAGTFKTDGTVKLENYLLPQFTNTKKIMSDFHMLRRTEQTPMI
jgi:hypothetical protein